MNGRKEAWMTQRIRESEWPASFDGDYAPVRTVQWYARAPSGGIPAAGEYDATMTVGEGEEAIEVPVMKGDERAKARSTGSAECDLYYLDEDRRFQPYVEENDEGEYEIATITVYNWSINPIPKDSFVRTEVVDGDHFVLNGECKKDEEGDDDEDEDEFIIDGGEWT